MDLKNRTTEDLLKLAGEKREALHAFRFAMTGSKKKNVKEGKYLRKEIARILTAINNNTAQ
ncbi:MAG: hypothetical protein Greene041679_563 [Parcubacteria group bacterium Greene0416_79]|nr:MAG: hypothetical protein Greene041679_563 [Parcubacteria group bacterium Greene0416_79]